jgi:hypothetical protein
MPDILDIAALVTTKSCHRPFPRKELRSLDTVSSLQGWNVHLDLSGPNRRNQVTPEKVLDVPGKHLCFTATTKECLWWPKIVATNSLSEKLVGTLRTSRI